MLNIIHGNGYSRTYIAWIIDRMIASPNQGNPFTKFISIAILFHLAAFKLHMGQICSILLFHEYLQIHNKKPCSMNSASPIKIEYSFEFG